MSSRSDFSSASASATLVGAALLGRQLVDHRQVVEALPQILDAAQLALGVGQLAGDLLGPGLVVPQVGIGGLVLELLDAGAQPVDIEHPLHRGQGGVEGGDVGLTVGIHGSSGYRAIDTVPLTSGIGCAFSIGVVTSPATSRQPLARSRAATEGTMHAPLPRGDRRLRPFGLLRRGFAAEVRRRRDDSSRRARRHAGDAAHPVGSGALRRRARPPEDQVDQRPVREDRAATRASASSATS